MSRSVDGSTVASDKFPKMFRYPFTVSPSVKLLNIVSSSQQEMDLNSEILKIVIF